MKYEPKKIDRYSYEWETHRARDRADDMRDRLERFDTDPDKSGRDKAHECKCCYYLCRPRIGGAACCQRPCCFCGETIHSGSTSIGVACGKCADERGLCAYCGGDRNGKVRRKVDLEVRPCA